MSGVVFFDADDNSLREASEAGVPDVTIRLNGRFQTRSDAQGRYEFPAVAEALYGPLARWLGQHIEVAPMDRDAP